MLTLPFPRALSSLPPFAFLHSMGSFILFILFILFAHWVLWSCRSLGSLGLRRTRRNQHSTPSFVSWQPAACCLQNTSVPAAWLETPLDTTDWLAPFIHTLRVRFVVTQVSLIGSPSLFLLPPSSPFLLYPFSRSP